MFTPGINSAFAPYKTVGLLSFLKKINFTNVLNTTQKTLNIVNQAIPIVYQVKPLVNNAKTVFKVISAVKSPDTVQTPVQNNYSQVQKTNNYSSDNYLNNKKNTSEPVFFL